MSRIRNFIASQILGGLLVTHASAAVQINFDNAADLADNFTISINTDSTGPLSVPVAYSATSGLGGTGGLSVTENSYDQFAILDTPFALAPGTTYSVSTYIRSYGYVGVGFADANSYTSISFQPTNSIMLSLGDEETMNVSNYYDGNQVWNNDEASVPNSIAVPPQIQPGDWMALNLNVTYNGLDSFDLAYSVGICDTNGNVVNTALNGSYNVTNTGLTGNLYPFIFFQNHPDPGQIAADNFSASAVPEPSSAVVAMMGLTLGLAGIRRR